MNDRRHHAILRAVLILIVFAAAMFLLLRLLDRDWNSRYHEVREEGTQAFMDEGIVEWNGGRYRKKPALTVLLLAGIDKDGTETVSRTNRYRNGGQADFLMLLAIDHGEKQIHQLQIDRDTMTDIVILGVYGNETGTRELQICLAHSFGARPEDNAKYTVRAVKTLLDGIDIDGYYMVDYSAVSALTDALGGVPVTIPEDMTSVNPEWYAGHTITLKGKDAETFVRTRQTVGGGTNAERMTRQAVYMRSAISKMNQTLAQDTSSASTLLSALKQTATTDLTEQTLLEEITAAHGYEMLPIDYLPGEYILAENDYVEFYPEEGSATAWIMTHLYNEK